jgi:hypothetical protein
MGQYPAEQEKEIHDQSCVVSKTCTPNAFSVFNVGVFDIPLEGDRNNNDRSAFIGAAFDSKIFSGAGPLYEPPVLVAILLEDPLRTEKLVSTTCPQWDDK